MELDERAAHPRGGRVVGQTRRRPSTGAIAGTLLAIGLFCFIVAFQRGGVGSYDGNIMFAVARNIVRHGSLKTSGDPYGFDPFDFNTPYSVYGIGTSLLILPATALELALGTRPYSFVLLMNPMVLAATGVVVQRIGVARGWSLRLATGAAIACVLCTPLLWAGTDLFSEPSVTLCCAVLLLAAIRWRDGKGWAPFAFGTAIAVAIQFRSDSILLIGLAVVTLPLFVPWRVLIRDRRALALLLAPIVVSLILLTAYDMIRFNSPFPTQSAGAFTTPLDLGLRGLLVSTSKGLFVLSPFLLIGLVGFVPLFRRDRAVAALVTLLCLVRLFFYARWSAWEGGVGWGPRFLAPTYVLLIVPTVEALRRDAQWRRVAVYRVLAAVFVPASFLVSIVSVAVPHELWWNTFVNGAPRAEVGRRIHDYFFSIRGSHLAGNLRLIERGDAVAAPFWWREGPRSAVIALLLVGTGSLVAAIWVAWHADDRNGLDEPRGSTLPSR